MSKCASHSLKPRWANLNIATQRSRCIKLNNSWRSSSSQMPASYELTYFDAAGRAEPIRVMLHAAGVEFRDNRFPKQDWPAIKSTTPLGALPTLKIGDVTYCQSLVCPYCFECTLFLCNTTLHLVKTLHLGSCQICSQVSWFLPWRSTRSLNCWWSNGHL
jgi:hypothetical protein